MPLITCHFSDGASFEVNAPGGRSFLELALEQGVPIRNQCRSGTCLSCICLGAPDSEPLTVRAGRATSLMPTERDEGKMLCCVSKRRLTAQYILTIPVRRLVRQRCRHS